MDIQSGLQTAIILASIGLALSLFLGVRLILDGRSIPFFRIRQKRVARGWQLIGLSFFLGVFALILQLWGEPVAYSIYPPSPTATLTPSISPTPSITPTPTITETPSITPTPQFSETPTPSLTPFIPPVVEAQFTSLVTPNPAAVFSPLQFSRTIDNSLQAITPATSFENPIQRIHASYSYNNMTDGAQWTAIWYRNGDFVHVQTAPWNGSTGGYGTIFWEPSPDEWLPGTYEVRIFVGMDWKVVGQFIVTGDPPQSTRTPTATITQTPSPTSAFSATPTLTATPVLSATPTASATRTPTNTPRPATATNTPRPTDTRWPSQTPTP
jgi:hypothetical protein